MLGSVTTNSLVTRRPWGWFAAWCLTGGLWSFTFLAIASVGIFVLPVALVTTAILVRRSYGSGMPGLLSGLGLPVFYVAYLNRDGPGNVCTSNSGGGQTCIQKWSPWPWLAAALVLTVAGLLLFRYRQDQHKPGPPKLWHTS